MVALAGTQTEYTREQALAAGESGEPSLVVSFTEPVKWNGAIIHYACKCFYDVIITVVVQT